MPAYTDRQFHPETRKLERHDFGAKDRLGRTIGAIVQTEEVTYVETANQSGGYMTEAGHYFALLVQATRNGKRYGASQAMQLFATEEERAAAITKYLAAAAKRATRK